MPVVHIRTVLVLALFAPLTGACAASDEACTAARALEAAPATLSLVEGGRGVLAMPRSAEIALHVDGLLAGFTTRRREDGALVVVAPYGITGTLPARIDASCQDGDRASRRIDLIVEPIGVVQLASLAAGPGARRAPGMAVVEAGVLVIAGFPTVAGGAPLDDLWLLPRGSSAWRRLELDAGVGAGSVRATAMADGRRVLLLGPSGATAIVDVAPDGAATITALAPGGAIPTESDGASLLHVPSGAGLGLGAAGAGRTMTLAACGKGAVRHCRVAAFVADGAGPSPWRVLEPTGFAPVGRDTAIVAVDLESRRLVLFGGERDDGWGADAWTLSLDGIDEGTISWAHLGGDATPPAARRGACGALDPIGHRLLVMGGADGTESSRSLLAYDLEPSPADAEGTNEERVWREIGVDGLPDSNQGCSAAWDPVEERLVIGFGSVVRAPSLWALELSP